MKRTFNWDLNVVKRRTLLALVYGSAILWQLLPMLLLPFLWAIPLLVLNLIGLTHIAKTLYQALS